MSSAREFPPQSQLNKVRNCQSLCFKVIINIDRVRVYKGNISIKISNKERKHNKWSQTAKKNFIKA